MATVMVETGSTRAFLQAIFGGSPRNFAIRLWDGTLLEPETVGETRFTLVLNHPGALRQLVTASTDTALAEAYMFGDFDIEGDIESAVAASDELLSRQRGVLDRLRLAWRSHRLPAAEHEDEAAPVAELHGTRHSRDRDSSAVRHHYDVSNDFYGLWLDRRMVYSCAYFERWDESLDAAQEHKLDYICRKLRLRPGERMLDIGCGWGGLIIHAAREYGVDATGITLSPAQAELARERIAEAGLEDRCRVELRDYRDVRVREPFDKLASVGMFEHVGRERMADYFAQAFELLRPGGAFLNHAISGNMQTPGRSGFSDRYVFPDHDLVPIGLTLEAAEQAGFEVRDVESLREHYMVTLRHWVRRMDAREDEVIAAADEVHYRAWKVVMAGSAHGFETGQMNLHQALLLKPTGGVSGLPPTRRDWFA